MEKTMKTFKNCAAQGELLFTRVDDLPAEIVKVEAKEPDFIVGHSETGHHHVMSSQDVEYFHAMAANDNSIDEFVSYLKVKRPTELRHLRSFDTHESIQFAPGIYRINRQREYTMEGFRKALD